MNKLKSATPGLLLGREAFIEEGYVFLTQEGLENIISFHIELLQYASPKELWEHLWKHLNRRMEKELLK